MPLLFPPKAVRLAALLPLLLLVAPFSLAAPAAPAQAPHVFWASDPVGPDETVLLTGDGFGPQTRVALGRIAESGAVAQRLIFRPLQVTPGSVKFVVPKSLPLGIYECRTGQGTALSAPVLLNAPDLWWTQGDQGDSCAPGGWLRAFGKSLNFGGVSRARLTSAAGHATLLRAASADGFALRFAVPKTLAPGRYALSIHNGFGGPAGWTSAGTVSVAAPSAPPTRVFRVMGYYGADAEREIAKTLDKGSPPLDRTAAIQAALDHARASGGGIVYFDEGKYAMQGPIQVPPHTILRGAGAGLVTLWWGKGSMALDGGSDARHLQDTDGPVPPTLISGTQFGLQDISLYLPRDYQTAIDAGDDFRMQRVVVRIDRYWIRSGEREDGTTVRLGNDGQVTDCDILAKGVAFQFSGGHDELIARNKVMAGKSPCALEHSDGVIVEDNDFLSIDPTAYTNLANEGRNIYFAHNRQHALYAQQSDFSWTFDGSGAAYLGKVAACDGTQITLAADPAYPTWAEESSPLWKRAAICVLDGRGAGQYRLVTANNGRAWRVDRPFAVPPDNTSTITIIPFRGRVLMIGNTFEDAGWVNAGYGSSFDVICANNTLRRVGSLLNLGLRSDDGVQPSWGIEYLNNDLYEGDTLAQTTADMRNLNLFAGPISRAAVYRNLHLHADNSGHVDIGGNTADVVVEDSVLDNPRSFLSVGKDTQGVLLRRNKFAPASPGYTGDGVAGAVIIKSSP